MPICKRDGFDNMPSRSRDETFHDNDEVFFCEVTKEIFRDYEDYFRHVMVINSTVWQCEATGRDNLTYAEALRSERRARKKMELFKYCLRAPVLLVIENSKQSSLNTLCVILCKFLRKRFFINEEVMACHKSSTYNPYTVIGIIPYTKAPPANGVYEETEKLQYKLRRKGSNEAEVIVPFEKIRRQRQDFTTENLQMFVKDNVTRIDGILRPKPESYKKYVTGDKIHFENIFIGKMPHFTPAKIKRPPQDSGNKKQSTLNKYFTKDGESESSGKSSEQEAARQEKKRADEEARMLEKLKRIAEQERQKVEKRAKLIERVEAECTALLTKTDDLERTDQRLLPIYKAVKTYIPTKLVGDAFMIREFMHCFPTILSGIEVFRGNLSFYDMCRAFSLREVAGPLSDIILIFLGTVFDLQKEEEEDCSVEYVLLRPEMRKREPLITMSEAARAHSYAKRHFSFKINELPIDSLTLGEVLRLHLLSSGSLVKERAEKWRIKYRNGYSSSEDPGLALRMRHPHILRALKMYTLYQLPFIDIMRIVRCLMAQILTYSSPINLIEERMEQVSISRTELRVLSTMENMRLANVQTQKRTLTNEFNQQCMTDEVKSNEEKKKQLEDKLNKKVAELLAQSERERRKFEQQLQGFNSSIFNFLVYLGMDRAYRKYYVLESMPGVFVEHTPDNLDTCLSEPPQNALVENALLSNIENLPRTRKDLRAYLLKMYTNEDKQAAKAAKAKRASKSTGPIAETQEQKEDKENHLVNGIANGKDVIEEGEQASKSESDSKEPLSQYQLFMCTGDPRNCIVHDERNADRQRWSYIYEKEDIDALISALNPLGDRESRLKEQLTTLRQLIINHCKKCPEELLTLDEKQLSKFKAAMMTETYRKYNKANFGFEEDADLNEVMHAALVDRIIQFESDIYTGDLGRLKVKDMVKWRTDLQSNKYDSQVKLQWGPNHPQKANANGGEDDEFAEEDVEEDIETDAKEFGQYGNKPFRDPGDALGDTIEIDSEDSADDLISLHDSNTIRTNVRNSASALLQVEQAIERRFIKEPFGAPIKDIKDKDLLERKLKWGAARLKQWELSLMQSTSFSQVFLHLNVLHDCILWARSTNKSLCQVCRRGSDPDKMLLCDECNGGTHMFCMKPKMKTVPEGNWYCARCVKRLGLRNENEEKNSKNSSQKRKRTFNIDDNIDDGMVNGSKDGERARSTGRRSNKRLQSNEIEETLDNYNDEATHDSDEEANGEYEDANNDSGNSGDDGEVGSDKDEDAEDEAEVDARKKSEDGSEQEEDDNVCVVCSYDGSDLMCIRCKETFHLECINMKRAPRYNFICSKCKSTNGNDKRSPKSARSNGKHILDSSNDDDDEDSEPLVKRKRPSRSSLRHSGYQQQPQQQNGLDSSPREAAKSASQRRSIRRTGDHLPLNSAALYELLDDVMKHQDAWPFTRPVSQAEVPDYHKIIKTPMDLAKVKSKLNMGAYQLNEEVMKDIQLIFRNCDEYNVKGNEIYTAGCTLENYVIEQCKRLNLPFKPSDMNSS
ncbi:bromodomain adjacent to zinc finger domain protein 1A [Rhagoletis pomonella]|uniref:bromodomain adjacent to zinc finger domain protein 1A n=1 Tax=Rhagoletis pomonella TaxID=28610 RepID=UPI00178739D0|nr:bromodomain adjacent to zinc finger domain protein 1A [Rhagoletis pomonella]